MQNLKNTIRWLIRLNRPPLPECPIQAATQGKEPKAPHYIDGKIVKSVNWKHWQTTMPPQSALDDWFRDPRMGIGTLGGWNGKHYLCWIDIDQKTFASQDECDRRVTEWEQMYWLFLEEAPMFRTPNGGYRYLVAFSEKPEGFGANNGFSFSPKGDTHAGELLLDKGHTLLPPTIGLNQKPYYWVRWFEYPPVVSCPADVGLYAYRKPVEVKPANTQSYSQPGSNAGGRDTSITDFLMSEVYPRLSLEQAFNWSGGHDFVEKTGNHGRKLQGNCPWHDSTSGTSFYCQVVNGLPMYRCPVDGGGDLIQYRHRLTHGASGGSPRGKEFIDIAKQLALEAGVLERFPGKSRSPKKPEGRDNQTYDKTGHETPNQKEVSHEVALSKNHKKQKTQTPEQESRNELLGQFIESLYNNDEGYYKRLRDITQFARDNKFAVAEIWKLYNEYDRMSEMAEVRDDTKTKLDFIIRTTNQALDLHSIIPEGLANPILQLANLMNLRPECYLTVLLSVISSLLKSNTSVLLLECTNFKVMPNLFAGIVAEPSQRKSPVFDSMIKPLGKLGIKARENYEDDCAKYERDIVEYKNTSGEEKHDRFPNGEPVKPRQRIYNFTKATGEGLIAQVTALPAFGLLWSVDELAGLFKSSNAYRQGRGSDDEDILSFYDGSGSVVLRADGIRANLDRILLSIVGTIQPEVLYKMIGTENSDVNGKWSRFMFVQQPISPLFIEFDSKPEVDIYQMMAALYKNIDSLTAMEYILTPDAKQQFIDCYNEIEQARIEDPEASMRAAWGKMPGRIGKIALALHVLKYAFRGEMPYKDIDLQTLNAAISLAKFYQNQLRSIYFGNERGIAPQLMKLVEISNRVSDWKKASYFSPRLPGKPNTDKVRELMKELTELGYGQVRGVGKAMEFQIK